MIGVGVTDMIAEAVLGRKLETTGHEVLKAVHPHPTMSEAVMEAVANAYDEVIHLQDLRKDSTPNRQLSSPKPTIIPLATGLIYDLCLKFSLEKVFDM